MKTNLVTILTSVGMLIPLTSWTQEEVPTTTTTTPSPITDGSWTGSLESLDRCDDDGRWFDEYIATLSAGEWVRFWVEADEFDTVMSLTGPDGNRIENDDLMPGTLSPGIELAPELSGEYLVRVWSFGPGVAGDYTLGMRRYPEDQQVPVLPLVGEELGTLDAIVPSSGLPSGSDYWVEARAGERIRLRITSTVFDTTAILFGPGGQLWSNDDANDTGPDDSESDYDSTLNVVVPTTARYHLLVSAYGGGGTGAFRVNVTRRDPVTMAPGEESPSVGYAGREGNGRIVGLFAGITEYSEDDELFGCADDAQFLARAFRERGLQSSADQIILLNAEVTRSAFLGGLHRLDELAGEDDLVVIFYSGHGGTTTAGPVGDELDGIDETLTLFDAEVTDDEVVGLIDLIEADTIILALDSCHSGGFARDFVSRPGRIGLFSSDQDVLSDTAEIVHAGGYLSHYLRQAVLGEADLRPSDGAMTAGELGDFMQTGFMTSFSDMNPPDSTDPLQSLVLDRGSLSWTDLLWLTPRHPDGSLPPIPNVDLSTNPANSDGSESPSCR